MSSRNGFVPRFRCWFVETPSRLVPPRPRRASYLALLFGFWQLKEDRANKKPQPPPFLISLFCSSRLNRPSLRMDFRISFLVLKTHNSELFNKYYRWKLENTIQQDFDPTRRFFSQNRDRLGGWQPGKSFQLQLSTDEFTDNRYRE